MATITARPVSAHTASSSRRHSHSSLGTGWWNVPLDNSGKRIRAATAAGFEKHGGAPALQSISEDSALETRRQTRFSKRFSWVPGWAFAGGRASTADVPKENTIDEEEEYAEGFAPRKNRRESRLSSVGRRISSISESWVFQNEPSHETNFPPNVQFPDQDGKKINLRVFGTIDSVADASTELRLQIPRGAMTVDLAQQKEYVAMLDYVKPRLKDGDMLVKPFQSRYARDKDMAMIMRGAIQDCVFKCQVIGLFPMRIFGEEKLDTYQLEVQLY